MQATQINDGPGAASPTPISSAIPNLVTVPKLAEIYRDAGETPAAIRAKIFRADDRTNSRGDLLPGNGLGATGAIVRVGRKVLLDPVKYGTWLAGGSK